MNVRALVAVTLLMALTYCHRRDDLRGLQILNVVRPDATCQYATTNGALSAGLYDPTVPGASSFGIGLQLRNTLEGPVDLLAGFSGTSTTVEVEKHPLQVQAVEACWFLADDETSLLGAAPGEPLVPCNKLPAAQRALITTNGVLDAANAQGVVTFSILDLAQLRSVLGDTFSPDEIPSEGQTSWIVPGDNGGANAVNQYSFSPSDKDAASSARSSAWGDKYPKSATAQIIYQMRVKARGPGSSAVSSNWLSFPITICPKCLLAQCGTLVEKTCAKGPCSDGTPCLSNGQCADTTLTCSATTLYSGSVPDFGTAQLCLPAQQIPGTTQPTCAKVGCDL